MQRWDFVRKATIIGLGAVLFPEQTARAIVRNNEPLIAQESVLGKTRPWSLIPTQTQRLEVEVAQQWQQEQQIFHQMRPAAGFWTEVFRRPNGSILVGDASNGMVLAQLPEGENWKDEMYWNDKSAYELLATVSPKKSLTREVLENVFATAGRPIIHAPTNRDWWRRNVATEGPFLQTITSIYESFGVPKELAGQLLVESGLNRTIRSEKGAFGMSQWLELRWNIMKKKAPYAMPENDRFSQVEHTAAYLQILAGAFGSFTAALSAYHAGETNLGRIYLVGQEQGVQGNPTEVYLYVANFFKQVRALRSDLRKEKKEKAFREQLESVDESYGPRSWNYTSIAFAGFPILEDIIATVPQEDVHRLRVPNRVLEKDVREVYGWSKKELNSWNPHVKNALLPREPFYGPTPHNIFSVEQTYWNEPIPEDISRLLRQWRKMQLGTHTWTPESIKTIKEFQRAFSATNTRQGEVFSTVLELLIHDGEKAHRDKVLNEYLTDTNRKEAVQKTWGMYK